MTSLNNINFGLNQYCGPAVLSALTGENTDRCAAVISSISGQKTIKGTERRHLKQALLKLRFDVTDTIFAGSTLYGTLHRMHTFDGLYVVFVPKHVIAIEVKGTEIYICDNHCKTPLDIKQSARLMQKVEDVWRVFPKELPIFLRSEIVVHKEYNRVTLTRKNIYKNPEDNNESHLGGFSYANESEMKFILEKLGEIDE